MSKAKDVIISQQREVICWLKDQVCELQSANLAIAKAYAEAYANAVGKFAPDPQQYPVNTVIPASYSASGDRFMVSSDNGEGEDNLLSPIDSDRAERRQAILDDDDEKKAADGNIAED